MVRACDDSIASTLGDLMHACEFTLNENSLEFFFADGCVAGITLGREDPILISAAAKKCVDEQLLRMRLGCSQSVCVRVEHSTLAAL